RNHGGAQLPVDLVERIDTLALKGEVPFELKTRDFASRTEGPCGRRCCRCLRLLRSHALSCPFYPVTLRSQWLCLPRTPTPTAVWLTTLSLRAKRWGDSPPATVPYRWRNMRLGLRACQGRTYDIWCLDFASDARY